MTHIFGGVTSDDPLKPLTPEELKEYRDNEKKKVKDDDLEKEGGRKGVKIIPPIYS